MSEDLAGTALATSALALVDFGARRGLPRVGLLAAAGLAPEAVVDPDARVPILALVLLWRELLTAFPDEVVPIAVVSEAEQLPMGILAPLARTARTLRDAIDLANRYGRLVDSEVRSELVHQGDEIGVTIAHRPEVEAMGFPLESMAAWTYRMSREIAGPALSLRRVTFPHRPRHPAAPYEAFFGAPVELGAPRCALWLDAASFDAPLPRRDDEARRYLEAHAARLVGELPAGGDPFRERLSAAIAEGLGGGEVELAQVARRLAVSTRTLQRRLTDAGTSFQEVVDDVRRTAAERLLGDRARTILDVAFELGYADLPGFYRAFKRWTGQTPAEWRRAS